MSLSPEWLAEIERRSAEFDTDQATGVSWEEVKAASLKRLAQDGLPRQTEE
jgi:putative addiction module component (TIGR02574 family)